MADFSQASNYASYDYGSPFLRCNIISTDGETYPLWSDLGLTDDQKEAAGFWDESTGSTLDALPYVQELVIEMSPNYVPIMKVRLVFPYHVGIAFLNSKLIEWGYSTFEAIIGYTGGTNTNLHRSNHFSENRGSGVLAPTFQGVILKPEIEMGQQITVTINAVGVGGYGALGTQRSGGPYRGTRKELIKIFADGPNELVPRLLKIDYSKTEPPIKEFDNYSMIKLGESVEIATNGRNDWTLISELLDEADCWMTLIGDTIVVTPKADLSQPVSRIFRFNGWSGGDMSSGLGVYPILSLATDNPAIYMASATLGTASAEISSDDPSATVKFVVNHKNPAVPHNYTGVGNVGPGNTPVSPSTSATAEDIDNGNQDGYAHFAGSPEVPRWVDQMISDHKAWSGSIGLHLTINTLGLPDLLPLENIAVRGCGDIIDDINYTVFKITHTLGLNGFTTTIIAVSNVQGQTQKDLFPNTGLGGPSSPTDLPETPAEHFGKELARIEDKAAKSIIKTKQEQELDKLFAQTGTNKPNATQQAARIAKFLNPVKK